ncbi:MAG: hypothetical protein ACOCX2_14400 [Armatimonadota bacterium]
MKPGLSMVIVAVAMAAGAAFAAVTLNVGYEFEVGDRQQSRVTATIDSVEMGKDVPLAVTGDAAVDVTLEVTRKDEQDVATIRASFGEVEATLMDEPQDAGTPTPADLLLDRRGALVGIASGNATEMDLFASGGIPLQLVVMLSGVVEMPDSPIGVGETWTIERCQEVPQVGEVAMTVTSQITEIGAESVVVLTDLEASLPEIKTASPMHDGDVTVKDGVLTIKGMKRTINLSTGLIGSAEAKMRFDGFAAIGPFAPLPLGVTSSFRIAPAEARNDG